MTAHLMSKLSVSVLFHILGLWLIRQRTQRFSTRSIKRRYPTAAFVVVTSGATLLATCLHGIEAGIWAVAYLGLGALPDFRSAMLFCHGATVVSYKHYENNGAASSLLAVSPSQLLVNRCRIASQRSH